METWEDEMIEAIQILTAATSDMVDMSSKKDRVNTHEAALCFALGLIKALKITKLRR